MDNHEITALGGIAAALIVGVLVALAGSQGSVLAGGLAVFAWCAIFAFGVQWLVFVHAWLKRTEHYFDAAGSVTYVVMVFIAVVASGQADPRDWLLAGLIVVWAARLGSFLFRRIRGAGEDRRFRRLKESFVRFLMVWTLQGLWVFLTASCALAAITSAESVPLGAFAAVGAVLWLAGFAMEVVADRQKTVFRADPSNADSFITTGLWAWSRHPNYAGEILLWVGIAAIAFPVLSGWQWVTLISPIFVYVLLTRISGVPMLESRAKKRWGQDPEFQAYMANTPAVWPRPPKPLPGG